MKHALRFALCLASAFHASLARAHVLDELNALVVPLAQSKGPPVSLIVLSPMVSDPIFLVRLEGVLRRIRPLAIGGQLGKVLASEDGKWIAVWAGVEGTSSVDVFAAGDVLRHIDDYPVTDAAGQEVARPAYLYPKLGVSPPSGYVKLVEWRGREVIVASDRMLSERRRNDEGAYEVPAELMLDQNYLFALNPETGRIRGVSAAVRDARAYYRRRRDAGPDPAGAERALKILGGGKR